MCILLMLTHDMWAAECVLVLLAGWNLVFCAALSPHFTTYDDDDDECMLHVRRWVNFFCDPQTAEKGGRRTTENKLKRKNLRVEPCFHLTVSYFAPADFINTIFCYFVLLFFSHFTPFAIPSNVPQSAALLKFLRFEWQFVWLKCTFYFFFEKLFSFQIFYDLLDLSGRCWMDKNELFFPLQLGTESNCLKFSFSGYNNVLQLSRVSLIQFCNPLILHRSSTIWHDDMTLWRKWIVLLISKVWMCLEKLALGGWIN